MKSDCDKPIVLYGEGGCGKTSLLAKAAGLTSSEWFAGVKPISVIRFLGTTPDSSALTPTLISICQQVRFFYKFQKKILSPQYSITFCAFLTDIIQLYASIRRHSR